MNEEEHNNLFSMKKNNLFFNMKEKFLKLKNMNKNNFAFKDKLKRLSLNKNKAKPNNEFDQGKKKNADYFYNIGELIEEKCINKLKRNILFRNLLEKNNDMLDNQFEENRIANTSNYKDNKLYYNRKQNEYNNKSYSNIKNKMYMLKKSSTHTCKIFHSNIKSNQIIYNEFDKRNIFNNNNNTFLSKEFNYINKSILLRHSNLRRNLFSNSSYKSKLELISDITFHSHKKKRRRQKHIITTMVNNYYKMLLNKKDYYNSIAKNNILDILYYLLLTNCVNFLLIFTITYLYMNKIYYIYMYSKHVHLKEMKKEKKRNVDFNHIVRIIYNKNVFSSNAYTLNISKNKNIYLKKNIFKQIFVQNKKSNINKNNEKYVENDVSSDTLQMEPDELKYNFSPSKYDEIKDKKNILSIYKSAKTHIKSFMSKHMILNNFLEKFLNLFNYKNLNLTKIVIAIFAYFAIILFPIKFHHLVILKLLHWYYKGYLRRYYKNVILYSILENIKNIKKNLKLYKPICSLNEDEYYALIEEVNKTCNQCLNLSQFKDINDEYDLAIVIMNNLKEFSEIKKIIRHEWYYNLLNNSPHDNTNIISQRNNITIY
ncbi:hypothetical protein PFMC_05724 [Plasmodium falciparum CAMP/Malaysia]|nr:hypothetical protein PFMC_05724 [Plasmodium falciparum CAMP/Malaysia]